MAGSQGYIFLSLFLPPHVLWEAVVMLSFRYSAMFSVLLWGPSENFNQSWPVITVSLQMNLLHRLHFYSSPVLRRRVLLKFSVSELIRWSCTTSKKDIKCFLFSSCKMALFFLASLLLVKWWWYFFLTLLMQNTGILWITYTLVFPLLDSENMYHFIISTLHIFCLV